MHFPGCLPDVSPGSRPEGGGSLHSTLGKHLSSTPIPYPCSSRWKTSQPRKEHKLPDPSLQKRNNTSASSGSLGNLPWCFFIGPIRNHPGKVQPIGVYEGRLSPPPRHPAIVLRSRQTPLKGGRFGFNLTAGQSNEGTSVEQRRGLHSQTPSNRPIQMLSKPAPTAGGQRFLLVNLSVTVYTSIMTWNVLGYNKANNKWTFKNWLRLTISLFLIILFQKSLMWLSLWTFIWFILNRMGTLLNSLFNACYCKTMNNVSF